MGESNCCCFVVKVKRTKQFDFGVCVYVCFLFKKIFMRIFR